MNKTLEEAFELIESMASHNFQWSSERSVPPQNPGKYQLNASDGLAAQVEMLNRQMAQILSQRSSSVSAVQASQACQICGQLGHQPEECSIYVTSQNTAEVNYTQNQGAYSNSYNPSWRHHPNLSYKSNQPQQQQHYPQASMNQGFGQQTQSYQPNNKQQNGQASSSQGMEEIIKMQMELMNKMNNEMGSMKDSVKQLSSSMESIVPFQTAHYQEKLPSKTEANPRQCGAISLKENQEVQGIVTRSGKS